MAYRIDDQPRKKKSGIDEFIEFDKVRGEIRMSIPMENVLDPEKNKKLREHTYE